MLANALLAKSVSPVPMTTLLKEPSNAKPPTLLTELGMLIVPFTPVKHAFPIVSRSLFKVSVPIFHPIKALSPICFNVFGKENAVSETGHA